MSRICRHDMIWGRCPECEMGYVPPEPPVRLNLDRFGLPKDYATYVWLLYGKRVVDDSPERRRFLYGDRGEAWDSGSLGLLMIRG